MKFVSVRFWNENSVGVIAIDNGPENLLDVNVIGELMAALTIANQDRGVKYVALTATGSLFFTGGVNWASINPDYDSVREFIRAFKALESLMLVLNKPIVTILNGSVMGLGIELIALSDLTIAPPDVKICHPEGALGLPLPLTTWMFQGHMPRLSLVKLLSGDPMDSTELAKYGLVHIVPRQNLFGDAKSIILSMPEGVNVRSVFRSQYRSLLDDSEAALLDSLMSKCLSNADRDSLIKVSRGARLKCASGGQAH